MKIEDEQFTVRIPPFSNLGLLRHRFIPGDIEWFENAVTFIHYDFKTESAEVIYKWESERYRMYDVDRRETFLNPSIEYIDGRPIEDGLLIAAFNLRTFAAKTSTAYLNNKDFNPLTILGVWVKG